MRPCHPYFSPSGWSREKPQKGAKSTEEDKETRTCGGPPKHQPSHLLTAGTPIVASHSAKTGPGQQPTLPLISDDLNLKSTSHHPLPTPSERRGTRTAQSTPMHSRESSTVRGRAADPSALVPTLQTRRGHSGSKSPDVSTGRPPYEAGLERRLSNSYGHHRQTSIVHGLQHSRNPSIAGSTASSPLSPELIASLSRNASEDPILPSRLDQLETHSNHQSPAGVTANYGLPGTLSTIQDTDADERMDGSPASLVHKRMNSGGKSRRDRSHSRSHSKHHSESKTVGEYALHHLFNSVRRPVCCTGWQCGIRETNTNKRTAE